VSVEGSSLLRLEKSSLRERALSALRRAITTGQLKPGTHLVETELSEALQISRGTLREALRQLQQEGTDLGRCAWPAVGAAPRLQGDSRHLQRAAALESLAARELASRTDRAEAAATLRGRRRRHDRWAASNLEDRIEADLRFHRTMCQLTGNETLLHQWTSLEGSIRMSIMFAGVDRAIKNMDAKRHLEIVDAIESGDSNKAAAASTGPHGRLPQRHWSPGLPNVAADVLHASAPDPPTCRVARWSAMGSPSISTRSARFLARPISRYALGLRKLPAAATRSRMPFIIVNVERV